MMKKEIIFKLLTTMTNPTVALTLVKNKTSFLNLKMMILFQKKLKSLRKTKIKKVRILVYIQVKLVKNP